MNRFPVNRLSNSILLQPRDIQPSRADWKVVGVFNPAVVLLGKDHMMIARVAERPSEKRLGWTAVPSWARDRSATVDWIRDEDLQVSDARVALLKPSGDLRLTSVSHLQVFRQSTIENRRWELVGAVLPEEAWEEYGIEDPRITKIDSTYWITYVAVSRSGAATALLSSEDMVTFQRHGIIFASENKDVVLFPQRVANNYLSLHRPNPSSHFSPPQIWLARSPDLIHWGQHQPILKGIHHWEGDRVGGGTPPILIDEGWLTLYHGSERSDIAGTVGRYAAGAILLDRDDPSRVIARSAEPIMMPTLECETSGFVPNVVFPTAMLDAGDHWDVYYGAADTSVAMTQFSKQSILDSLVPTSKEHS
ncbi:Beta-1,4-mannooligosaccharide phosphorylase [Rubripirellula tenax]|uniref:Beta-1,4-mannooligosaccharide phosphorylase n=1 Tax=Rubripirellula tenax TaxID=2528015 RepID=A0A5C6EBT2_9BACT|nr:glycoside hydrolase family 130 protein [Rubripirellula tenax]TWU44599.1 Beta-1,4-mannooligosaccharide phosphorylase [Rubripirellula tenax]